jgi:hypothetical protein
MQNIEQLFARELKVDEARSVFPEYGFTDSMGEHITTRAYATISSLLLYGAKRGLCAVAMRVPGAAPQQPQPAGGDTPGRTIAVQRPPVAPRPATPKQEEDEVKTGTLGAVEPEVAVGGDEAEIKLEGDDGGKSKSKRLNMNKIMNKITELFTGKDDGEYTF